MLCYKHTLQPHVLMQVKREHPGEDANKILGDQWKLLSAAEKAPYKQRQAADKMRCVQEQQEQA